VSFALIFGLEIVQGFCNFLQVLGSVRTDMRLIRTDKSLVWDVRTDRVLIRTDKSLVFGGLGNNISSGRMGHLSGRIDLSSGRMTYPSVRISVCLGKMLV
jgi:hypothetical protein